MYLFVVGDFFRRRRRRRRARDPLPTAPLLRVLIFWLLFGLGALLGGVALATAVGVATMPAPVDRFYLSLIASFALGALVCLVAAIVLWQRLNRQ